MKFDILINQIDDHNEPGLILAQQLKINNIVFLEAGKEKVSFSDIEKLYKNSIDDVKLSKYSIGIGEINKIQELISKIKNKKILINLSGGERINTLLIFKVAMENNLETVYLDIINKKRYVLGNNYRVIEEPLKEMKVEEILKASGANIMLNASELSKKKDIEEITEIILNNLELWHKYKQRLYDTNTFIHDYKNTSQVIINKQLLNNEEMCLVNKCLKYLKRIKGINYYEDKEQVLVKFNNNYLKGFIFKSGTWLEVITHKIVDEINTVDDVESGVLFFWNKESEAVRNELDVLAANDSNLICISCKDSEKYNEDALNELDVYSKRLGGEKAIKILVATKPPCKKSILQRAKEMNINIVILDKDINSFKNKIIQIIKQ